MTTNPKPLDYEAERIAESLTKAQRGALLSERWERGDFCAYRLKISRTTLEALYSRGLVGKEASRGAMFSPSTAIEYPLTRLGLAVRYILTEKEKGE